MQPEAPTALRAVPFALLALLGAAACDRLSPPPPSERGPTTTVVVTDPPRQAAAAATPAPAPSPAQTAAPTSTFACGKGTCRSDEVCCNEVCGVCGRAGTVCPQKVDCPAAKAQAAPPKGGEGGGVKCGYDVCGPTQVCCPSGCAATCD